jgi:hypothetical protein
MILSTLSPLFLASRTSYRIKFQSLVYSTDDRTKFNLELILNIVSCSPCSSIASPVTSSELILKLVATVCKRTRDIKDEFDRDDFSTNKEACSTVGISVVSETSTGR